MTDLASTVDVPRSNGELVFRAPWESRAFGMAVVLYEDGVYDWDTFRERLAAEIAARPDDDGGAYYERWLLAFERVLTERGLVTSEAISQRVARLEREDAHDHDHEHDHQH
jgi:nitrile hydratase accessory protein